MINTLKAALARRLLRLTRRFAVNWLPHDDRWFENLVPTNASGMAVDSETALRVTTVHACCRLISGTAAKLPLPIYRRITETERERMRSHRAHYLLNVQPNRWQTPFEFRRQLMMDCTRTGNGYARIVPGPSGFAEELWPLPPSSTSAELLDSGEVLYTFQAKRGPIKLRQDEVLHLRDLSLDGVTGLSRAEQASLAIGLTMAAETYGASFFGSGAESGLMLTADGNLDREARERVLRSWRQSRGITRGQEPFVAEGGLKLEKLVMDHEKAQMLELRQFQVEDLARLWGVPPHLVGHTAPSTSWGTGIEQLTIGFLSYSLLDWLALMEQAVGRDLLLPEEREEVFAEHLVEGLLRGDFKARMDGYGQAIQNGIMCPNEARRRENLNPRPDGLGDRYWQPANMQMAGEADAGTNGDGLILTPDERAYVQQAAEIKARRRAA